jgi:hypothetical protein
MFLSRLFARVFWKFKFCVSDSNCFLCLKGRNDSLEFLLLLDFLFSSFGPLSSFSTSLRLESSKNIRLNSLKLSYPFLVMS